MKGHTSGCTEVDGRFFNVLKEYRNEMINEWNKNIKIKVILLKMAGLAQRKSDITTYGSPQYRLDSYYDDPRDQVQIKAGIELYKRIQTREELDALLIDEVFQEYKVK
jgi:hypothetical protein